MILVDTNIWVHAIRNSHPQVTARVRELLRDDEVVAHDFVLGELIMGKGGSTRKEIIQLYETLDRPEALGNDKVRAFVRKHGLDNRGIGWIDAHLLAAAHARGQKFWTADGAANAAANAATNAATKRRRRSISESVTTWKNREG